MEHLWVLIFIYGRRDGIKVKRVSYAESLTQIRVFLRVSISLLGFLKLPSEWETGTFQEAIKS